MTVTERDKMFLRRIVEYCDRIGDAKERFGNSFDNFAQDADYRDVVCMNIFQIGELANQVSEETQNLLRDIPWRQMYAIRNILAHAYVKIDDKTIWDTVVHDIPRLAERLKEIIWE